MNAQSPFRKLPVLLRIPFGVLALVLVLSMMACEFPPSGLQQAEETPASVADDDDTDDQVSTSVAQTVAALDQTRTGEAVDGEPPAATATLIAETTAPEVSPPPSSETTVPVEVGNSACGSSTASVCELATVVDVTALAVRDGPDTDATLLGEVARDRWVDVLCLDRVESEGREWACVRTFQDGNSIEGWMSTRYLDFVEPQTPVGERDTPSPSPPRVKNGSKCGAHILDVCDTAAVIEVAALAVRSNPHTDATLLDEVARDTRVDVLCFDRVESDGREWACVRTLKGSDSVEGWMSTRYLAFGVPEAPAREACDWATVVQVEALNMRREPSRQSPTQGEPIPQGGRVEVLCDAMVEADGRTWAPVRAGTVEGWMSTTFLVFDSAPEDVPVAPPPNSNPCGNAQVGMCDAATVVDVTALAVRDSPSRQGTLLGEVPKGRMVDVLCLDPVESDGREWVCVSTGSGGGNSVVGWMSTNYLQFQSDAPPPDDPPQNEPVTDVCDWAEVFEVEALTIRGEPTLQGPPMGAVPRGESVAVLCDDVVAADGRSWVKVRYKSGGTSFIVGWMSTNYLDFEFGSP